MAEYIDRIDFINKLEVINGCVDCNEKCRDCGVNDIKGMLRSIPAADVAPVVHGQWVVDVAQFQFLMCSSCGTFHYAGTRSTQEANVLKSHWYNYCPNCGAKMCGLSNG